MRLAFRVDSSVQIGSGHVMRCLALADELRIRGVEVRFVSRDLEGSLIGRMEDADFPVEIMPQRNDLSESWLGTSWQQDAEDTTRALGPASLDWLVVDHYGIDFEWHNALRPMARRMMVIDDLANRRLHCDVLLDQTLGREPADYVPLTPHHCRRLLGPAHALLRPEFYRARQHALARRGTREITRVLVTLGGADPNNHSSVVLNLLASIEWPRPVTVDLVLGPQCPHVESIASLVEQLPIDVNVHVNVSNMAALMVIADVAIGAAGSTAWERCVLGLPTIQLVLAENQRVIAQSLHDAGAALLAPDLDGVAAALQALVSHPDRLVQMSAAAANVCDGQGARWVAQTLIELTH